MRDSASVIVVEEDSEVTTHPLHYSAQPSPIPFGTFAVAVVKFKGGLHRDDKAEERSFSCKEIASLVCACTAYFLFIFCRSFLIPLAPTLKADVNVDYDNSKNSTLIIVVAIFYAIGKLVNGAILSHTNPRIMFLVYQFVSALSVAAFSLATTVVSVEDSFPYICATCALNALAQAGGWPAMIRYFHDRFKPAQYGRIMSMLSIFSRLGAIVVSVSIAGAVAIMSWESASRIPVLLTLPGMLCILATFFLDADEAAPVTPQASVDARVQAGADKQSQLKLYCSWFAMPQFWAMMFATACLATLSAVEGFSGLWIQDTLNPADWVSGMVAATIPTGVVISILASGLVLEPLKPRSRGNAVVLMLVLQTVVTFLLFVSTAIFTKVDGGAFALGWMVLMFVLFGLFLGYPMYIPPSVYQLRVGQQDSPMMSSLFDVTTAILGASVTQAVGGMSAQGDWTWAILLFLVVAVMALVLMTIFHWLELHRVKLVKTTTRANLGVPAVELATLEGTQEEIKSASKENKSEQPDAAGQDANKKEEKVVKDAHQEQKAEQQEEQNEPQEKPQQQAQGNQQQQQQEEEQQEGQQQAHHDAQDEQQDDSRPAAAQDGQGDGEADGDQQEQQELQDDQDDPQQDDDQDDDGDQQPDDQQADERQAAEQQDDNRADEQQAGEQADAEPADEQQAGEQADAEPAGGKVDQQVDQADEQQDGNKDKLQVNPTARDSQSSVPPSEQECLEEAR